MILSILHNKTFLFTATKWLQLRINYTKKKKNKLKQRFSKEHDLKTPVKDSLGIAINLLFILGRNPNHKLHGAYAAWGISCILQLGGGSHGGLRKMRECLFPYLRCGISTYPLQSLASLHRAGQDSSLRSWEGHCQSAEPILKSQGSAWSHFTCLSHVVSWA